MVHAESWLFAAIGFAVGTRVVRRCIRQHVLYALKSAQVCHLGSRVRTRVRCSLAVEHLDRDKPDLEQPWPQLSRHEQPLSRRIVGDADRHVNVPGGMSGC